MRKGPSALMTRTAIGVLLMIVSAAVSFAIIVWLAP
jgi:hypothetical protein